MCILLTWYQCAILHVVNTGVVTIFTCLQNIVLINQFSFYFVKKKNNNSSLSQHASLHHIAYFSTLSRQSVFKLRNLEDIHIGEAAS